MREILFRGKRLDNGEWVEGNFYMHDFVRGCGFYINTPVFDPAILPDTLGEYTGLNDKNGKKIFEGDIVKYKYAYGSFDDCADMPNARTVATLTTIIKYIDGGFRPRPFCRICDDPWYSEGNFDFEVIGNIYDNPELFGEVVTDA